MEKELTINWETIITNPRGGHRERRRSIKGMKQDTTQLSWGRHRILLPRTTQTEPSIQRFSNHLVPCRLIRCLWNESYKEGNSQSTVGLFLRFQQRVFFVREELLRQLLQLIN